MRKTDRVRIIRISGFFLVIFLLGAEASGQIAIRELKGGDLNTINTAVPFLTIAPDSRAGSMGDVGIASKPDLSSQHWNVAKYAFMKEDGGLAISYTPWLRHIISDINLAYLSTYYKPTPEQVISGSLRYFSLGQITFTDNIGEIRGQFTPFEMALDAGYSRLFTDNFSGGVVFRYIHSDLTSGQTASMGGGDTRPGIAVGADLGFYYEDELVLSGNDAGYAWGITLSNLGTPIAYSADREKIPIPSNIGIGGRFDYGLDDYNTMSFMLDLNKLLVPTRPVMEGDSVIRGYDTPESIVMGMIQSFYDAPGIHYDDGSYSSPFREEMAEIMISLGAEYWYREQFAIRAGYFHETAVKGNRKYATLGVGLKLNVFSIDFAYLIPTNGVNSPLANTLRFTMGFDFESLKL